MSPAPKVECPNCGKSVVWSNEAQWRPFCSERCKMMDLGSWANGEHVIPGDRSEDEKSTGEGSEPFWRPQDD